MKRRRGARPAPRHVDLASADLNDADWTIIRRALETIIVNSQRQGLYAQAFACAKVLDKIQRT